MARELLDLMPGPTDRAVFVGQTGSGKTTLARHMCTLRPFVVVLDIKGNIAWDGYTLHKSFSKLANAKIGAGNTTQRLIFRPDFDFARDESRVDEFFEWIYRRGGTTVYVDETFGITSGNQYPRMFGACLTRGRELEVCVWCGTQRPMDIPQVILSESEHVNVFRLKLWQDRRKVSLTTALPEDVIWQLPKQYFFHVPQDGDPVGPLRLSL